MRKLVFIALLMVCGCTQKALTGSGVDYLYTDEKGAGVYEAECDLAFRTMGDCYKLASEQCGGAGFKKVSSSDKPGKRTMVFSCKVAE